MIAYWKGCGRKLPWHNIFFQHFLGNVEEKTRKASVTIVCAPAEIQIGHVQNTDYIHQEIWLHASELYSIGSRFKSRLRHPQSWDFHGFTQCFQPYSGTVAYNYFGHVHFPTNPLSNCSFFVLPFVAIPSEMLTGFLKHNISNIYYQLSRFVLVFLLTKIQPSNENKSL